MLDNDKTEHIKRELARLKIQIQVHYETIEKLQEHITGSESDRASNQIDH